MISAGSYRLLHLYQSTLCLLCQSEFIAPSLDTRGNVPIGHGIYWTTEGLVDHFTCVLSSAESCNLSSRYMRTVDQQVRAKLEQTFCLHF